MTEEFRHNTDQSRFEAWVDDEFAGEVTYVLSDGIAEFDHTWVEPAHRSTGIAGRLVQYGFDTVRAAGEWRIRPVCPFVASWTKLHPEYQDLVVA
ncbi:MAG: GNAT family N-acetyltransferase [Propionicimonas sp.]|uniref:GNAT family N-acetyltransferase n=1 Tax=Propionicimonas sp. TaxID=1955623 RepID=UPI002B204A55|nr:GNAT family N-acetyltransferase [Propionicimonas sp.]MEA4945329.1 GNAT family N-acetyltransferase [Propionicimonas sp.]MEA5053469.1 GNAT family N-acetyltransferase [Propionicimonas sp.]